MSAPGYAILQRRAILAYWPWVRPGVTTAFLTEKARVSDRQLRRDLKKVPSVIGIPDERINRYFRREHPTPFTNLPHSPLAPVCVALVRTERCHSIENGAIMQAVHDLAPIAGWAVRSTEQGIHISTGGPVTFLMHPHSMLVCSDEPDLLPEFADILKTAFACYESADIVATALSQPPEPEQLVSDEWTSIIFGTGATAAMCDASLPFAGGEENLLIPSKEDRPAFFFTAEGGRMWLSTRATTPKQQQHAKAFHTELRVLLATNPDDLCRFFGVYLLPDNEPGPCTNQTQTLCDVLTPSKPEQQIGEALGISTAASSAFLAGFAMWARSGYRQTVSFGTVVEGLLARGIRVFTSSDVEAYLQELETAGLCQRDKNQTLRFTLDGIRLGRRIGTLKVNA